MRNESGSSRIEMTAWVLVMAGLLLTLVLHLVPALLAGLLIYELVEMLARWLRIARIRHRPAKILAVAVLVLVLVLVLAGTLAGILAFVRSESGSLPALLQAMADVIERWRTTLPAAIVDQLPADVEALKEASVAWLRAHAGALQHAGTQGGRALAHILIGAVVGAFAALHETTSTNPLAPLAQALETHAGMLSTAFRRVVFSQMRISAINAILTGLYLVVALPLAGIHLPLAKTMIAVTFFVGLLPVVGNLPSNAIIVVLSLSVSPGVAITSLLFLIVIHKLEYFLNAHIIGTQVRAHAWELLVAMLVLEAAFGVPGLIAAPVFYAYLKDELVRQGWV